MAPPVERIERRYSLDEIRYSPTVRQRMPSIDVNTINFELGSWEVPPDQAAKLQAIADGLNRAIQENPRAVFLIEGHTDAVGNDVDNLSLSDRRAESAATLLTQQFNVPAENLTSQGYGEQYLKEQTDGPSAINRRVTIRNITPLLNGGQASLPPPPPGTAPPRVRQAPNENGREQSRPFCQAKWVPVRVKNVKEQSRASDLIQSETITLRSRTERRRRDTGLANRPGVPMIGAAAAAENAHLRKRAPEIQITPPEIDRVARIERFGFVELGMALRRGIGPDTMNTPDPGLARLQRMLEMRWMGAVDQKIFRRTVGLAIHGFDRLPQRFAHTRRPLVSTVNEMAACIRCALAARATPIASLMLLSV